MHYYGEKKSAMTWATQIFLGICVLVFIGAVIFVVIVTRDGGRTFKDSPPKGRDTLLSLEK